MDIDFTLSIKEDFDRNVLIFTIIPDESVRSGQSSTGEEYTYTEQLTGEVTKISLEVRVYASDGDIGNVGWNLYRERSNDVEGQGVSL